jgi:hypothetical protein
MKKVFLMAILMAIVLFETSCFAWGATSLKAEFISDPDNYFSLHYPVNKDNYPAYSFGNDLSKYNDRVIITDNNRFIVIVHKIQGFSDVEHGIYTSSYKDNYEKNRLFLDKDIHIQSKEVFTKNRADGFTSINVYFYTLGNTNVIQALVVGQHSTPKAHDGYVFSIDGINDTDSPVNNELFKQQIRDMVNSIAYNKNNNL